MTENEMLTENERAKIIEWLKSKIEWFESQEFERKWQEYLAWSKREIVPIEEAAKHFGMPVELCRRWLQERYIEVAHNDLRLMDAEPPTPAAN